MIFKKNKWNKKLLINPIMISFFSLSPVVLLSCSNNNLEENQNQPISISQKNYINLYNLWYSKLIDPNDNYNKVTLAEIENNIKEALLNNEENLKILRLYLFQFLYRSIKEPLNPDGTVVESVSFRNNFIDYINGIFFDSTKDKDGKTQEDRFKLLDSFLNSITINNINVAPFGYFNNKYKLSQSYIQNPVETNNVLNLEIIGLRQLSYQFNFSIKNKEFIDNFKKYNGNDNKLFAFTKYTNYNDNKQNNEIKQLIKTLNDLNCDEIINNQINYQGALMKYDNNGNNLNQNDQITFSTNYIRSLLIDLNSNNSLTPFNGFKPFNKQQILFTIDFVDTNKKDNQGKKLYQPNLVMRLDKSENFSTSIGINNEFKKYLVSRKLIKNESDPMKIIKIPLNIFEPIPYDLIIDEQQK